MAVELAEEMAYLGSDGCLVRVILMLHGDNVHYFDMCWPDCELLDPHTRCSRATFRRWVDRPLTPVEIATFPADLRQRRIDSFHEVLTEQASALPTKALLAVLAERGYDITHIKRPPAELSPPGTRRRLDFE